MVLAVKSASMSAVVSRVVPSAVTPITVPDRTAIPILLLAPDHESQSIAAVENQNPELDPDPSSSSNDIAIVAHIFFPAFHCAVVPPAHGAHPPSIGK